MFSLSCTAAIREKLGFGKPRRRLGAQVGSFFGWRHQPFGLANLLGVAYLWGGHQTDLRNLTWSQVPPSDSKDAYVHVDESKTRKERDQEITPTVRYFLERAAAHREAVAARHEAAAVKV